jgi:dihydrofolate reductase
MQNKPTISLIAAIARTTRVIGKEGGHLPWHIPEDFKHFKQTTMGHPIIMGRTTFEEFGGKLLPGRTHIVITRQADYAVPEGVIVAHSIAEAIERAAAIDQKEIFIIGGGQIYAAALPFADRLYLTLVDADITGPVTFPEYGSRFSKIVSRRESKDENFAYEFVVLEK